MPLHDALYGRKPDASAGNLRGSMQPLKHAEQVRSVTRIEAYAIVLHVEGSFATDRLRAEPNTRHPASRSELPCVVEQILEHDLHELEIAVHQLLGLDDDLGSALRRPFAYTCHDDLRQGRQVDDFAPDLHPGHASELEQVVDQARHPLGTGQDPIDVATTVGIDGVVMTLPQQAGKARDCAQGPAKVM